MLVLFLMKIASEDADFLATLDGQRISLSALCRRSSRSWRCALNFILRPSALRKSTPLRDCGGYCRWGQQLVGCRGSRAALRRVEHPGQGGGRTRAALRRVGFSAQEVDGCSVTMAQWLSEGQRCRWCFPADAGRTTGSRCFSGLSDAPTLSTRCGCRAATEHRINIAHLVLHPFWNGELSSGKQSKKGHKRRARFERTPALKMIDLGGHFARHDTTHER